MKSILLLTVSVGLALPWAVPELRAAGPERPPEKVVPAPAKEEKEEEAAPDNPADAYFQGWLLSRDAEKLREKGKAKEAQATLLKALMIFRAVQQQWPDWKKEMVRGRLLETERILRAGGWKEEATI